MVPHFKALWSPYGNYLCVGYVVLILATMLLIPGVRLSVLVLPFWVLLIWGCFTLHEQARRRAAELPG